MFVSVMSGRKVGKRRKRTEENECTYLMLLCESRLHYMKNIIVRTNEMTLKSQKNQSDLNSLHSELFKGVTFQSG